MPYGRPWPSYTEKDVRALFADVLEPGERVEHLALGYERAGWKDLAWTAIRSALLAGVVWSAWSYDEDLGQAYAIGLTNRRLLFVGCGVSLTSEDKRRGKLRRDEVTAVRRDAFSGEILDGRTSEDWVTLCIDTPELRRCVFFEPAAMPDNLERSRRMLDALRHACTRSVG